MAALQNVFVTDPTVARFPKARLDARVTVGMSAYGNVTTTLIALRSLFNAADGEFELILVDDCSPDGGEIRSLFAQARNERPNTKVFSFSRNLEYSGSLNCILSHARGDVVLFLSNDIFVTPGYLRQLLRVAQSDPRNGIVRGCSNFVDNGRATHNVDPGPITSSSDLYATGERIAGTWGDETIEDVFLTGDAFLVTRAVLERIGTFDPMFYGYFADHDFGIRARSAGFRLLLARGAFAFHQRAANFDYLPAEQKEQKSQNRWQRVFENWARFKLKYGLPVERPFLNTLDDLPWGELNSQPFTGRLYSAPADYSIELMA